MSSKRFTRWLLAGVLAALPLSAPALAKTDSEYHLFVWKVTSPGATAAATPDYLIGTMHVPVDTQLAMPAKVQSLLESADKLALEADTDEVSPEMLGKYMFIKGQKNLKQLLPPASWKKLVKAAAPLEVPEPQLAMMEPWFLNIGLTMPTGDGAPVIDELVENKAREANVSLAFLEGAEEQLKIMDSVSQDEDVRQLMETVDDPKAAKKLLADMQKSYFAGDLKTLETLVLDPAQVKAYPDFYKKMLFDRNARWAPKVERLFKQHDAVVAVGLGHLLGKQGLVTLLEAKGYRVEPLAL